MKLNLLDLVDAQTGIQPLADGGLQGVQIALRGQGGEAGLEIHCMRDLTRGGLSSALIEIAEKAERTIHLEEEAIPVTPEVRGACELLGFDPLHVANEGRFVLILPAEQAEEALSIIRRHPHGRDAQLIGHVLAERRPILTMTSPIGTRRVIDMLSGDQLPRIC